MHFLTILAAAILAAPTVLAVPRRHWGYRGDGNGHHRGGEQQGQVWWHGEKMPADNGGNIRFHYTTEITTVTLQPGELPPVQQNQPKTSCTTVTVTGNGQPENTVVPQFRQTRGKTKTRTRTFEGAPEPTFQVAQKQNYQPIPQQEAKAEIVPEIKEDAVEPAQEPQYVPPTTQTTATTPKQTASSSGGVGLPAGGLKSGPSNRLSPQEYADICVYHHNIHRQRHGSPNVAWSEKLAGYASELASSCDGQHSSVDRYGSYGSNLAGPALWGGRSPGNDGKDTPNPSGMISDMWYWGEIAKFPGYGLPKDKYAGVNKDGQKKFMDWGHFTAMLWPDTTEIGCATSSCSDGWYGLCLYSPQGNMNGDYGVIGAPQGEDNTRGNGDS